MEFPNHQVVPARSPDLVGSASFRADFDSISVFSFIRDKKHTTINNWGHTLFVLESILSPVTLAFFLLALRRRFKR